MQERHKCNTFVSFVICTLGMNVIFLHLFHCIARLFVTYVEANFPDVCIFPQHLLFAKEDSRKKQKIVAMKTSTCSVTHVIHSI